MSWQTGYPPKSGYYICTWPNPMNDGRLVAEMWFNSRTSEWWLFRGKGPDPKTNAPPEPWGTRRQVLAWQPLPEPYQPEPPKSPVTQTIERLAAEKPQAPWPTLTDGFTPPGLQFYDRARGPMLLAQDPGAAWDGWLLVRNPENNGWVSLRKATDEDREAIGLVEYAKQQPRLTDLARAAQEGQG